MIRNIKADKSGLVSTDFSLGVVRQFRMFFPVFFSFPVLVSLLRELGVRTRPLE